MSDPEKRKFTEKPGKIRAVDLRVLGHSFVEIADILGRSERTIRGWFKQPEMIEVLEERMNETAEHFSHELIALARTAIDSLKNGGLEAAPHTAMEVLTRLGVLRPIGESVPDPSVIFEYQPAQAVSEPQLPEEDNAE